MAGFSLFEFQPDSSTTALQMSIKGIRAFSPDNDEKITFYKPLTLIVGHNGAGKTVSASMVTSSQVQDSDPWW